MRTGKEEGRAEEDGELWLRFPLSWRKKRTERRRRSNLDHWQDEADQKN